MRGSSACRRPGGLRPVLAAGLLASLVLTGCSSTQAPQAAPSVAPTPIEDLRTQTMTLPRIDFCSLVPAHAVVDALDGRAQARDTWGNGDRLGLPGGADTVAETGCAWSRSDGTTARAWVFARPVERPDADVVVAQARRVRGCTTPTGPAYGVPGVTQVCASPAAGIPAGQRRVRHAGLFGTTWLTCEVQGPDTTTAPTTGTPTSPSSGTGSVRARADAWCVEVANALDTTR